MSIYKQISTQILNINGKIGPFYFKEFFFIFFSLVIQIFILLFLQWLFNISIFIVLAIPSIFLLVIFILRLFARGLDPWYLFEFIDKFYQVEIAEGDSFKSMKFKIKKSI
ncbi:MAG: hypothetical protein GY830_08545 [Bacteroidetes bacterium]|nr:hypothetical protein [Bacteroidota bacterium]